MKKTVLFLFLLFLCASNSLRAQSAPASPSAAASSVRQIVLGNATVPLDGLWKFHTGDNMAWAQPGFDDSGWGTMDLTPPKGSITPDSGTSGWVPGWTAQGYKGYSGYAWYRLRVNIQSGRIALALKMPDSFDDAYQLYMNGRLIGQFGRFTKRGVTSYNNSPRAFSLPASVLHRNAEANGSAPVTIAIRMWMAATTPLRGIDAGGLHGPPVLGQAAVIHAMMGAYRDAIDRRQAGHFLVMEIQLLALLVAFGLFRLDRSEAAYLWLGFVCAVGLVLGALIVLQFRTTWAAGAFAMLLLYAVLVPALLGLWVLFWAYWFRLDGMARLHRVVWGLVLLLGVSAAMRLPPLSGRVVPIHASVWLTPLALVLQMLLGALLVWVTVRGIRKDHVEGWLALPAVLLLVISIYPAAYLGIPVIFVLFGARVALTDISSFVSFGIILVLLLRRFLKDQREREQWRQEIEQAKQVQQVLIPEELPHIPGLTIESEYRPAQQVGGDFFQIVPHPSDGSVLIVAGDVTGHGLQAGMLVALIVGAIRERAEASLDPLRMLQSLNRRLCGRGHAHATCLALRIASDGAATLANAGHLPPYLNGKELPMPGAMILGMIEGAEFSVMHFQLAPSDRLMLMSDGVAEAQDAKGKLFGFERIHDLLQKPISAAEVATAAQSFGQEDDISVLSVTRTANMKAAIT